MVVGGVFERECVCIGMCVCLACMRFQWGLLSAFELVGEGVAARGSDREKF